MKLTKEQREELETIYDVLQQGYEKVADALDFSCEGCSDNCCDSWFKHHTLVEWLYFREGFEALSAERQQELQLRAQKYLQQAELALQKDERPQIMCPLNEGGLCILYKHRFLVCRTHGVPAKLKRPDGRVFTFPGCFRCQNIVNERYNMAGSDLAPRVNRTPMLIRLANLEKNILYIKNIKIDKTIAEMILSSPENTPTGGSYG